MIENKQLLDYEYYLRRMSLFLNNAVGVKERVKILVEILNSIDNFYNNLFDMLDIQDTTNDKTYNERYSDLNNTRSEILDFIGRIFNCYRSQTIKVNPDVDIPTSESDLINAVDTYITLNDKEFLLYIKCQIIKQNFEGTREELELLYGGEKVIEEETQPTNDKLQLMYIPDISNPGTVYINWINYDQEFSKEFRYMFINGLLTIESVGIRYNHATTNPNDVGIWVTDEPTMGFIKGTWVLISGIGTNKSTRISFTSNNQQFSKITCESLNVQSRRRRTNLYYDDTLVYFKISGTTMGGWTNDAYKTVSFGNTYKQIDTKILNDLFIDNSDEQGEYKLDYIDSRWQPDDYVEWKEEHSGQDWSYTKRIWG